MYFCGIYYATKYGKIFMDCMVLMDWSQVLEVMKRCRLWGCIYNGIEFFFTFVNNRKPEPIALNGFDKEPSNHHSTVVFWHFENSEQKAEKFGVFSRFIEKRRKLELDWESEYLSTLVKLSPKIVYEYYVATPRNNANIKLKYQLHIRSLWLRINLIVIKVWTKLLVLVKNYLPAA